MNEARKLTPKERLAIPQQEMPAQEPQTRRGNMAEVELGYTPEMARAEASRCLNCPTKPCVAGCPVGVDIPEFVKLIEAGDDAGALAVIKRTNLLPAICGRVCPQERQCMSVCTVGKMLKDPMKSVAIGRLERYAADCKLTVKGQGLTVNGQSSTVNPSPFTVNRQTVGVVGSGPASLAFAADVARAGHKVVVFEALQKPGGVLVYGIPEFRLPKKIVETEIANLEKLGVEIQTNFVVGRTRPLKKLLEEDGFAAVFIGSGAGLPKFMNIPGENLIGVFSANEYLTRSNLMRAYDGDRADTPIARGKKIAVLGGGNVAMDAARTALRLGAETVSLIYRRTEAEMPARAEEVEHAKEEGVEFRILQNPTRIIGDDADRVTGIECLRYELGEPDASGRRAPLPVEGSEFVIEVDTVIVAIGNESNPLIAATTPELKTDKRGRIAVDENNETSIPGVFAGGDIVLGAATVILAMGEGRKAAATINKRLASVGEK